MPSQPQRSYEGETQVWFTVYDTHFWTDSHTMPGQQHSQPTQTLLGQGCKCLGVTCHLHFWQNDQGLLHAAAVTWGWNGHWIRVRTQLTLEEKILLPLLLGFKLATSWSWVRCSYQQAPQIPLFHHPIESMDWSLKTKCKSSFIHSPCHVEKNGDVNAVSILQFFRWRNRCT